MENAENQLRFNVHGGRNAFRFLRGRELVSDLDGMDMEELQRQQFAISSFTDSIEMDIPPESSANALGYNQDGGFINQLTRNPVDENSRIDGFYDCNENTYNEGGVEGGMKASSTIDTIIEVITNPEKTIINEVLGETQKYVMTVPGPGHVDQEIELHKSLLNNAVDESDTIADLEMESLDSQLQHIAEMTEGLITQSLDSEDKSQNVSEPSGTDVRIEFNNMTRPRPTTPTSKSVTERFLCLSEYTSSASTNAINDNNDNNDKQNNTFIPVKYRLPPDSGAKLCVTIPSNQTVKNRSSTQQTFEQPAWQTVTGVDLLEVNPDYARNAPPKPVVHRRSSIDWENFAENDNTIQNKMETDSNLEHSDSFKDSAFGNSALFTNQIDSESSEKAAAFQWFSSSDNKFCDKIESIQDLQRPQHEISAKLLPPAFNDNNTNINNIFPIMDESTNKDLSDSSKNIEQIGEIQNVSNTSANIAPVRVAPPPPPVALKSENVNNPNYGEYASASENQQYNTDYYSGYYSYNKQLSSTINANEEAQNNRDTYYGCNTGYDTHEQSSYGNQYQNYGDQYQNYGEKYQNYEYPSYDNYGDNSYDIKTNVGDNTHEQTSQYGYDTSTYNYDKDTIYSYKTSENYDYGVVPTVEQYGTNVDYNTTDLCAYGSIPNQQNSQQHDENSYEQYNNYNTSQYGNETQQEDYLVTDGLNTENTENMFVAPPPITSFIQPILPPQRARTPDPFSWEAQETAVKIYGTAIPPSRPPPIAPSPKSFSPLPTCTDTETMETSHIQDENDETVNTSISKPNVPPARPPAPAPIRPPPPTQQPITSACAIQSKKAEEDDDPWAKFKQMTEQVSSVVKNTTEQLKNLSEQSAANEIRDETYLGEIGGSQGFQLNSGQKQMLQMQEASKKLKTEKKKQKALKKPLSPTFDPKREEEIEQQAQELVKKLAASRADLKDWQPPITADNEKILSPQKDEVNISHTVKGATINQPIEKPDEVEDNSKQFADFSSEAIQADNEENTEISRINWAGFDDFGSVAPTLPTSESDFFSKAKVSDENAVVEESTFVTDPFAPINDPENFINDGYDPFDTRPVEEIIAETRKRIEYEQSTKPETETELFGASSQYGATLSVSRLSSPTPEGGSPISPRPNYFEDDFHVNDGEYSHTPTPLYDDDDSVPLENYLPSMDTGSGWELMLRHPLKKKIMTDRFWKPCFVCIQNNVILIYNDKNETKPYQEIHLQASYSLSDTTLQAYDVYGKIHTAKLQHILYKERVGIRAGQISRLVEGHITKYGLPLEHSAQCTVLAKFGSLNEEILSSFVHSIEDLLFKCSAKRDTTPIYKQDEIQVHCYDEYICHIDRDGIVGNQKARVRFFCLAFLSGSPFVEIGLNDRRRQGKEIVRRKDILPMYTERWIRFENMEFHNTVEQETFEKEQVIRFQPPDGCFVELFRFRIRPPKNREKALTVKSLMKIAGSKIEINIKVMAASQQQRAHGTVESMRTIPCEDIQIRFPIPEAWIYIFREERHWGVGSVHSKTRRTGKVKNLRDRLMGAVQHTEQTLIEVAIGEAKYEHVYRSLVWRIPRLPEKHHAAYKSHVLKCRFELSSFDLMPESFLPSCNVEFTMPLATVSNTVVRSISIEQHEDSDRVEKFVRYVAKCHYTLDVDYVQCNNLDEEIATAKLPANESQDTSSKQPLKQHISAFNPENVQSQHAGYGIEFSPTNIKEKTSGELMGNQQNLLELQQNKRVSLSGENAGESSSSDEEEKSKIPMIEINMQGYGY